MTGAYPGFCSLKQLSVLLLSPGWDAVYRQYPFIYTWVERDDVR